MTSAARVEVSVRCGACSADAKPLYTVVCPANLVPGFSKTIAVFLVGGRCKGDHPCAPELHIDPEPTLVASSFVSLAVRGGDS